MNWPHAAIGDVVRVARSGVAPDEIETGTTYVGLENIDSSGEFVEIRAVDAGELASSKFRFTREHVLFGKLRPYLKKTARPHFEGVCSTDILPMEPTKHIDRDYLFHVLRRQSFVDEVSSLCAGANLPRISPKVLVSMEIPVPPLTEQRRIAVILDKADAVCAKRREAIAKLGQLLQSVFLGMFGDPVTNPKGWPTEALSRLTRKIGSGSTPKGGDSSYQDKGISFIRSLNVHDGEFRHKNLAFIDDTQAKKLSGVTVESSDVLLNITGASVARVCRVPDGVLPARVNQHVSIIRCASRLMPAYLEHVLMNQSMKNVLLRTAGGGATREAITKKQIEELQVPVPPLDMQCRFSVVTEKVSSQCRRMTIGLAEQEQLFAAIQANAFSRGCSP